MNYFIRRISHTKLANQLGIISEILNTEYGVVMVNSSDKRNFYRMMLNSEVTLTVIDDEANSQIIATCRDLSATGMAIELSHPLALDTNVRVKVNSANNNVQSLDTYGKVVRIDEQHSDCYLIGILIEEVD